MCWEMSSDKHKQRNREIRPKRPSRCVMYSAEIAESMRTWGHRRGGVVPFTVDEHGEIFFCFGVDKKSGELTDFGGGLSVKNDERPILGAFREMKEETLDIFENSRDQGAPLPFVYNDVMCIAFLPINTIDGRKKEDYVADFDECVKNEAGVVEVSKIVWLGENELRYILEYGPCAEIKMYATVLKFLKPSYTAILALIRKSIEEKNNLHETRSIIKSLARLSDEELATRVADITTEFIFSA